MAAEASASSLQRNGVQQQRRAILLEASFAKLGAAEPSGKPAPYLVA